MLYARPQPAALVPEAVKQIANPTNATRAQNRPLRNDRQRCIRFIVFLLRVWPERLSASLILSGNRQVEMLTHYGEAGASIRWGFPLSTLKADSCAHVLQLLDLLVK